MDKTLESFLHPKRHNNIKFRLPAFENEFEMRELTVEETLKIDKEAAEKNWGATEVLNRYAAEALVVPNLRNVELQDELSKECGNKVLNPYDAYKMLFTGPEAAKIMSEYTGLANLTISFGEKVEEAKNS